MPRLRRGNAEGLNAWPGYVDALSTLLMVIIFVLLVFVLAQAFLSVSLSGSTQQLEALTRQAASLSAALAKANQRGEVAEAGLAGAQAALAAKTSDLADLTRQAAALAALRDSLQTSVAAAAARASALQGQLTLLQSAATGKDARIADLDTQLQAALAQRVQELQQYRSEFFGKLRSVLANQPGVQIVGDRFVFQSEVLFPAGSADLNAAGQGQIGKLAATLRDIAKEIPPEVNWVLRVDGHADHQPVDPLGAFTDNWDLSAKRAINVAKLLITDGIPPTRVAATAFADNQPLDPAATPEAYAKNRRIEIRLTDR